MCFVQFPMTLIQQHIEKCDLVQVDPNLVTCKFCKARMLKSELPDHAIAHILHQKQVEHQIVTRVADIEDFFEEEKLDTQQSGKAPKLNKRQLNDLPTSVYEAGKEKKEDDTTQHKCTVCQTDFAAGEQIRTLLCLHMFHKDCIDKWLLGQQGSCVVCKVIQVRPESPSAENDRKTDQAIREAASNRAPTTQVQRPP